MVLKELQTDKKSKNKTGKQEVFSSQIFELLGSLHKPKIDRRYNELQYNKSSLQSLLQIPLSERNPKILKSLRHELKDFYCFKKQIEEQFRKEVIQIIKRDNQILTNIMALYAQLNYYQKGAILDATSSSKENVKILLRGSISIFQPINYSSYRNCQNNYDQNLMKVRQTNNYIQAISHKKIKELTFQQSDSSHLYFESQQQKQKNQIINDQINCFDIKSVMQNSRQEAVSIQDKEHIKNDKSFKKLKRSSFLEDQNIANQKELEQSKYFSRSISMNNPQRVGQLSQKIKNSIQLHRHPLNQIQCQDILSYAGIVTPVTPHRWTYDISQTGHLLASTKHPYLTKQKSRNDFSSVCTSQCTVLELQYPIFKQILVLINSNQEKPYIRSLLKIFQKMEYFEAKNYIRKTTMIDHKKMNKKRTYKNVIKQIYGQHEPKNQDLNASIEKQLHSQSEPSSPVFKTNSPRIKKESISKDNPQHKQTDFMKDQTSSLFFEIPYTGQPYLIVQGQVKIKIDKISEYKVSELKHAATRKTSISKQLLKLYTNDMFGFQQIGQQKSYNLRYQIRKDSKILKMDLKVMEKHYLSIQGFKDQIQMIYSQRNQLIDNILKNIDNKLRKSMIDKYYQPEKNSKQFILEQQVLKNQNQVKQTYKKKQQSLSLSSSRTFLPHFDRTVTQLNNYSSEKKKFNTKPIQFIGNRNLLSMEKQINSVLRNKQKKKHNPHKKLTLQLLKEFQLVDIKQQIQKVNNKQTRNTFIQMRNQKGILLRRRSIPIMESAMTNRNARTLQKIVMNKIGLLSQAEKVKHNFKIVKQRKSQFEFSDIYKEKKQFKRLKNISKSIPILQGFYSKRAEISYNSTRKKKILVV